MCLIVTLTLLFLTCLCVSLLRWPFYFQHAYVSHCYVDPFISNMPWVSLVGAATSIIFVATEVYIYVCLLWQTFCCDKIMFVVTKLLWQQFFFVLTNTCLSRQAYFCRDKGCVCFLQQTRVCHKCSVTTKIHLSQQNFRRNKHTFVVIKMILWLLQPMICKSPQNKIKNSSWESVQVIW